YLIRTRVFFFPSYYREGTPRSVLEALATGLPVVTTNTPGCRDCVTKGENGYLCDPKDHEGFTGAISQIFGMDLERYSELSKASTLLVSLTFDENIVIDKILSEMNPQALKSQ
ncbi:glycosyltransferase, partial [Pseudomonadales bacterium]|nr:glycosyltransferase [Pseudomonadales bacterium]